MLRRFLRMLRYGALLFRSGGPGAFFPQIRRQLYSQDIFIGLEKDLAVTDVRVPSKLPYSLQQASDKDIAELLTKAKEESTESVHELIGRAWFYECGFHDCYAARTTDTGDLCFVAWFVSVKDSDMVNQGFGSRLPSLKDDELLLENCYTIEKYRGNNIMLAVLGDLLEMAKSNGFKRLITYVRPDNIASLRTFDRLDFHRFEEIPELKILFFTKRKHR